MKGIGSLAQRRVMGALATISVLGVTVFGVALGRQAFAGQTPSAPTGVLAHGSRADATHFAAHFLGSVDPARVPQMSAHAQAQRNIPPYMTFVTKDTYQAAKAKAPHSAAPSANGQVLPTPSMGTQSSVAPTPNTPAPTGTIQGIAENSGGTPSDMGLAAGGGYIVQYVNSEIAVYNTSGVIQTGWPKTSDAFFGASATNEQFDPRVLFDPATGRFFALMDDLEVSSGTLVSSTYYLAVSKSSNPTGGWWIYTFNVKTGNSWADFPMMGLDSEAVYFSGNHFDNSGNYFTDSFVFFANKASLEAGTSVTVTQFSNLSTSAGQAFTVHPALEYGVQRAEIMVDTHYCSGTCNSYDIWAISDPLGASPRLTYVTVGNMSYTLPPAANQPDSGATSGMGTIDTGDTRVSATPIVRNGSLYFAFTSGVNNGSGTNVAGILWLNMGVTLDSGNAACGAVPNRCVDITAAYGRENGNIIYSGTTSASYPSMAVDSDSNILFAYSYSSHTYYPSFVLYGRRATTQRGVMGTNANIVSQGQGYYLGFSGSNHGYAPPYRWGDYTAISLDSNACTAAGCYKAWFSGMYAKSDGSWGTAISSAAYGITNP